VATLERVKFIAVIIVALHAFLRSYLICVGMFRTVYRQCFLVVTAAFICAAFAVDFMKDIFQKCQIAV